MMNQYSLGNVWFVNKIKEVENADEEIKAIQNFDPEQTAVLQDVRHENMHAARRASSGVVATVGLGRPDHSRMDIVYPVIDDDQVRFQIDDTQLEAYEGFPATPCASATIDDFCMLIAALPEVLSQLVWIGQAVIVHPCRVGG